ncbi:MAG: HAD-IIA family hydrolase [Granulosicoccus sp.]
MIDGPLPTALDAVTRYEAIQPRLPTATFPSQSIHRAHLGELVDEIDCFVLDGFGVLNIGDSAVPDAATRLTELREAGKQLRVLTNGATLPVTRTRAKYQRWGMDFELSEVVSSRDALAVELQNHTHKCWGFAAIAESELTTLTPDAVLLDDDIVTYDRCDGFVLLGARDWTVQRQSLLAESLTGKPRPVLVGNPDLVAPQPGALSREPGLYAHDLMDRELAIPAFFGKPFDNAFALIRNTLDGIDPQRIAMVGDTLHTDILGGAQAGWKTVLVTSHGLLKGQDVDQAIQRCGIVPDYIVPTT